MKKSVYSLVLSDEIVDAIDLLAYQKGTSRSNLINLILAEHVSIATPEQQMRAIFNAVIARMDETYKVQLLPGETMLSIKSPLKYKYKPTIRYSVELFSEDPAYLGRLRIFFRTQSTALISALDDFFGMYAAAEQKYLPKMYSSLIKYRLTDGSLERDLLNVGGKYAGDHAGAGNLLAEFINNIDGMMKAYFANIDDRQQAFDTIVKMYTEYVKNAKVII